MAKGKKLTKKEKQEVKSIAKNVSGRTMAGESSRDYAKRKSRKTRAAVDKVSASVQPLLSNPFLASLSSYYHSLRHPTKGGPVRIPDYGSFPTVVFRTVDQGLVTSSTADGTAFVFYNITPPAAAVLNEGWTASPTGSASIYLNNSTAVSTDLFNGAHQTTNALSAWETLFETYSALRHVSVSLQLFCLGNFTQLSGLYTTLSTGASEFQQYLTLSGGSLTIGDVLNWRGSEKAPINSVCGMESLFKPRDYESLAFGDNEQYSQMPEFSTTPDVEIGALDYYALETDSPNNRGWMGIIATGLPAGVSLYWRLTINWEAVQYYQSFQPGDMGSHTDSTELSAVMDTVADQPVGREMSSVDLGESGGITGHKEMEPYLLPGYLEEAAAVNRGQGPAVATPVASPGVSPPSGKAIEPKADSDSSNILEAAFDKVKDIGGSFIKKLGGEAMDAIPGLIESLFI